MELHEFLHSLTDMERDFISNLDYGQEATFHRRELDKLIDNKGIADLDSQMWYPYEVVELGKNSLQDGHEREFVACAGIVMANLVAGEDLHNDWDSSLSILRDNLNTLNSGHLTLLEPLIEAVKLID